MPVLATKVMYKPKCDLEKKVNPNILKEAFKMLGLNISRKEPIHFHINSTSIARPANQLSFSSIEINKPHSASVHSVS